MRKWTLYDIHFEHARNMICLSDDGYYWAYDKFDDVITFGKDNHTLVLFDINGFKHDDTSYMLYMFERFITHFNKHNICGHEEEQT